jgi:hypothetical protein
MGLYGNSIGIMKQEPTVASVGKKGVGCLTLKA